jgi:uncharacterized membrane protein YphA (DoxX/SURF4 family)
LKQNPDAIDNGMRFLQPASGPASILLIRIALGLIFFTQGILKYIDPNMGVLRFTRIGFPHPYFTAHFVRTFEIVCVSLVLTTATFIGYVLGGLKGALVATVGIFLPAFLLVAASGSLVGAHSRVSHCRSLPRWRKRGIAGGDGSGRLAARASITCG